jgi:hypothetical protein
MAIRNPGESLEFGWEQSAVRAEDGATIRRVGRSRYYPTLELEHTEDQYHVIIDANVVAEEMQRRSPATRSYSQMQARRLFEHAGLVDVEPYSGFNVEPVRPEETLFTVVGRARNI